MSKELPPSRTAEQFVVRFPDGMRDKIANAAKANNRSMNAEIVARLEQTFSGATSGADLGYVIEEMVTITMESDNVDRATALERLVAKGYASTNSAPVFIYYASPGMTAEEIRAGLIASNVVVPPDAHAFFDRTTRARTNKKSPSQGTKKTP